MGSDQEQLQILSIFHYVVGALTGLFSLIPVIHLMLGLGMVTGGFGAGKPPEPFAVVVGWMFVVLASTLIACGLAFAIALIVAGNSLVRHERYSFCFVVACIACLIVPFGTLLGIFTLLVLLKPSVKQLFGVETPPAPPAA